jgi:hypothetical protein
VGATQRGGVTGRTPLLAAGKGPFRGRCTDATSHWGGTSPLCGTMVMACEMTKTHGGPCRRMPYLAGRQAHSPKPTPIPTHHTQQSSWGTTVLNMHIHTWWSCPVYCTANPVHTGTTLPPPLPQRPQCRVVHCHNWCQPCATNSVHSKALWPSVGTPTAGAATQPPKTPVALHCHPAHPRLSAAQGMSPKGCG